MKRLLHTPQRLLCFLMLCLVAIGGSKSSAQEVTLDFTKNTWGLPEGNKKITKEKTDYKSGDYTITLEAASSGFYFNADGYLILGKANATLTLPTFDFDVEKIEVVGNKGASGSVKQNIYVGTTPVSTETTGAAGTNSYTIKSGYESSGTYTLKVTSKHNSQITAIKIYKKTSGDKTSTALSFGESVVKTTLGDEIKILPTLKAGEQTISGKSFTWTSGNKKVATVDNEGNVTTVGAGKTTITASFDGDNTYVGSSASYELMVKGVPQVSFADEFCNVTIGDDFTSPKLQGVPDGVNVTYSSSNPAVATVDETTGEVNILAVGTTTITATTSVVEDIYDEATASYELTVEKTEAVSKTVVDLTDGYNNGEEVTEVKRGNIALVFEQNDGGSAPAWYKTGTAVRLYSKNSLTISSNSRIKNIAFVYDRGGVANSTNTSFSIGKYNYTNQELDLSEENATEATLTYTASSKHVRIQKIIVTTYGPSASITIGTNEGYGTYYTDVNYVLPEGLKAYGYTAPNADGTLTKTEEYAAGDVIPANTAVVVEGTKGTYDYFATDKDATKTVEGNLLKGVTETTTIDATENVSRYILTYNTLGELAFYMTNSGNITVQANRAYLEIAGAQGVSRFVLDGQATGIEGNKIETAKPATIYTLGGVRLKQTTTQGLPAGAYIVNGKVVIVK